MTQPLCQSILANVSHHLSDSQKIEIIAKHFELIMETLGLDLEDESLRETPFRIAKMYVKEIFSGLDPSTKPHITLFENKNGYSEMLVEKDIIFNSYCEHHFVPFFGKAHVAYYPHKRIVGLSKLNRIVQYLAKKPQVQERLTVEIGNVIERELQTDDVAVVLEGKHLCIASRGVEDVNSVTRTSYFNGKFAEREIRNEFLKQLDTK
ncbi:MAG: GTP cyclohydrolase I FolE [Ignavibacteriales bacterium]|nr:GTP cyclohydrolase I FolE [Ignavibacteriales bacterium]